MNRWTDAFRRLWRPSHPLFWMMLGANALSSLWIGIIQWQQPPLGLHLLLALLALSNSLAGAWMAVRLWREGEPAAPKPHDSL